MRKLTIALLLIILPTVLAIEFQLDKPSIKAIVSAPGEVGTFKVVNPSADIEEYSLFSSLNTVSLSEDTFSLNPRGSKEITLLISQLSRINSFEVTIKSNSFEKVLPVVVEYEDEKTIFDSGITIDQEDRNINAGDKIMAEVDIIGTVTTPQRISMTYYLYDFNNNEIFSQAQDIIVSGREIGKIEIDTPSYLTSGRYLLAVVLNHGTEWSTATESFTIEGETPKPSLFFNPGVIAALISGSIILVFLFRKTHHHLRRLEVAHWSNAFEFRKHRLHMHKKALHKRLDSINKHLERGNITKETHSTHHSYITDKIDEIDHILGLK